MSLLSTMLAFALVPLAKKPNKDEVKIAALQGACKELVYSLGQSEGRADALQAQLNDERVRGELDRAQTRHWRQQADYWQQAARAVPNQWGPNDARQRMQNTMGQAQLQNGPMQGQQQLQQYHQAAQNLLGGQQLGAQQLWQQAQNQPMGWLDCTCVPGRSEALLGERRDLYPRTPW
jgi:hypothetical protein